ncbi:cbb3-type cytochrome oxidase assembly protein CcoS [Iodobacter fluviatilis]|jgi:cbb3-type cytochrome oxidase maturation protein|uniref:Cbb3-type cytochrome oxidase assembly protein CcoS n=1 Tax=Iodobacter fluviatilis TaxID=537 RepID=A0A7G3GDB4_9NEIS|nr:cbb3-type cytochrome oxidase assembly protein CcoS [Iodobacter fluviatilis]QBC45158.1 cbb3-type cytochrome oxidase assembly protein CcoS [Iodobacter fluviatilis]
MESLYLLIPLSVLLVFLIGILFWWSLRGGQFDDMEGPGWQILQDDDSMHAEKVPLTKEKTRNLSPTKCKIPRSDERH